MSKRNDSSDDALSGESELIFWMGKYAAVLPRDRRYCRNHMWCQAQGERWRFGFTSFAVRLMQDVYFLDWYIREGDWVDSWQHIGHIETSKATADLFAPLAGRLVEINQALLQDPSPINLDGYGAGWLFAMSEVRGESWDAEQYKAFLEATWEETQRTLKGDINR
ncbi:MAG: glycine cleavage system protein H [Gemmatales bacterium]|nr:glycine cleavage system protein H [Gemmatales bacterium]MDW7994778.1 glycine cleavage system protein H [Gemmatales bacterium]